ncbi:hypothetical protein [Ruegeria sp. Alg231-54]|uniref:hypothetical protein n=1 Tax=Ruegeria sp. Alg231-54 TaxID=1922221 RepID=UPI000D554DA4|nr:hypothetical protein [Ruegeria sp. Alg231-54]
MKPLPLLVLLLTCAACTDFPELEGREQPNVRSAAYPKLVPLQDILGPPINPVNEAAEVEEDLTARREALAKRAEALQNVQTN